MDDGLTVAAWSGRARADALASVKRKGRASNSPCCICGQPIDYSLVYPHKQSCSVQHVRNRRDYPQLTWDPGNWAPSHLDCNKSEGTGGRLGLGVMGDW